VGEPHRGVQLEARQPRLGDGERAIGKAQHVADEDVGLDDPGDRQVLAQRAGLEPVVPARDAGLRAHRLPEAIVLARIDVDRLRGPAVHARVGLLVALEAGRAHPDALGDRALADRGEDGPAGDLDLARTRDVDADDAPRSGHRQRRR